MRTILVIGSSGLVGSGVSNYFKHMGKTNVIEVDLNENFDLKNKESIKEFYLLNPDINFIINCSGLNDHIKESLSNERNKTDLESIDIFFNINVKSVCWIIEYGHKYLKGLEGVINFSSLYGIRSPFHPIYDSPKSLSYTISKHALEGVTRYYAAFYGKDSLRINAVRIGGINASQPKKFTEWFNSRTPLGRMAEVDDLYGTINLLCSKQGSYITGQNICIDGGYTSW